MDVSVQVRYNRTHVPVRFMTEIFGAEVNFIPDSNMVTIKMENASPTEVYDEAIAEYNKGNTIEAESLFLRVLEIEPSHAGAMLKLGKHYAPTDKAKSAIYYEQFLKIQPKDYEVWNSLGWTYADLGDVPKAMEVFKGLTTQLPDTAAYWIALGDMYSHYQIQDCEAAKECITKLLHVIQVKARKPAFRENWTTNLCTISVNKRAVMDLKKDFDYFVKKIPINIHNNTKSIITSRIAVFMPEDFVIAKKMYVSV